MVNPNNTDQSKIPHHVSPEGWTQWIDTCTIEKCSPKHQKELARFAGKTLRSSLKTYGQEGLLSVFQTPKSAWIEFETWLLIPTKKDTSEILTLQARRNDAEANNKKQEQIEKAISKLLDRRSKAFKELLRSKPNAQTVEANVAKALGFEVTRKFIISVHGKEVIDSRGKPKGSYQELEDDVHYQPAPGVYFEPQEKVNSEDQAFIKQQVTTLTTDFFESIQSFENMAVLSASLHRVSLAKLENIKSLTLKKSQLYNIKKTIIKAYDQINFEDVLEDPAEIQLAKFMLMEKLLVKVSDFLSAPGNEAFKTLMLAESKTLDAVADCLPEKENSNNE